MLKADYLIIGSGIAGLSLAIKLAERFPSRKIIICTKGKPSDGSTDFAQGGIAVVTDFKKDSFEKHIDDTLVCGHHLNTESVVKKVVEDAPDRVNELIEWGFRVDKNKDGEIKLGREGGHSEDRIVHHQDQTGHEIEITLLRRIKEYQNINLLSDSFAIELIESNNRCYGAIISLHDENYNEEITRITANATILATGGIGQIYGHTTNPMVSTGDGIAMAYRVGVNIEDMEFVQFHPTAMYLSENKTTFLISEAVRGAGAILRNINGDAFMLNYDKRGDLAPRDIVSQSIVKEMDKTNSQFVYLDCTHIEKDAFEEHFPMITEKCKREGIDVHTQMIPVAPAQHYLCGGIVVDNNGATNLQSLYACGECTKTGLHGANRLASNSLLEALIYADSISNAISLQSDVQLVKEEDLTQIAHLDRPLIDKNILLNFRKTLHQLMIKNVGIVRKVEELQATKKEIQSLHQEIVKYIQDTKFDISTWEVRNMIETSLLVVEQSLSRKESVGTFKILRNE